MTDVLTPTAPVTDAVRMKTYRVVIVGGGSAGISVAARLAAAKITSVAIVEPLAEHYYQPLWTLVGGGAVKPEESRRQESSLIPSGCTWVRDSVASFDPDANTVLLESGGTLEYEYLVACPGIQVDFDRVDGLAEIVGTKDVSSNYRYDLAPKTFEMLDRVTGGTLLFTMPSGPIKCAGAPQKIMYLAANLMRKKKIKARIVFASATPAIFGVEAFQEPLMKVVRRYGIETMFNHNLVAVDADRKVAIFEKLDDPAKPRVEVSYAFMHVTPPQSAPDFVKKSPLAETTGPQQGYVKIDPATMRSPLYPNVFALGDAGSSPNSKTGAAIRKQAPVVVENMLAAMRGKPLDATYDGYASCPLVTGYGKLILAEFDYDGTPTPSFPIIDLKKERWSMFMLKRHFLPWMYWNLMLRGRA